LKALETLAQQYYTLPNGMALLKATYLLMPWPLFFLNVFAQQYLQHDPYELIIHHQKIIQRICFARQH
jgi:hypothetical protein